MSGGFGGLHEGHIDAFAGEVFESVLFVFAIGFVEDDSVFVFGVGVRVVGFCNVLGSFYFCVVIGVHRPF